MKLLFSLLGILSTLSMTAQMEHFLIIGTYTSPKSEGVYVYRFNSADGTAKEVSHVHTSNPSFVAVSPDEKFVYAVLENAADNGKGGAISAFSFDKATGKLTYINQQPTGGDHPCHVAVDKTGKWVTAGNYSSGSLSLLPINPDGSLGAATTHIQHEGKGANPKRQDKPHVHSANFSADNKFLFVPDLGIDKVMIYAFDEKTGKLSPAKQPFAKSVDGAGPRHFAFHPTQRFAYLIEEMGGSIVAFKYKNGALDPIQRISTMAEGDSSYPGSADIHVSPDGKFLYASNRSTVNNIAIYSVGSDGKLSFLTHQSTLGNGPRNFNFDPTGNFLLVANQDTDQVVVFKRDKETGLLTDTGHRIEVGKPVCLKWISLK